MTVPAPDDRTTAAPLDRTAVASAAGVLARALADDPGWTYVFTDPPTRVARMTALLAIMLERVYLGLDGSWHVPGAAAAIWAPPGRHDLPVRAVVPALPRLAWLVGRGVPRGLRVVRAMGRGTPGEPHWYLAALGVDPAHQGRGLGPRVIAPVLERCDATRTLAWLESTNPKNHTFYRRCGFEVADQVAITGGGPTITFFARRPR
ncbi:MAG TPA: GNAT family N-acetyltransferase [Kofleriaceae bacterium]|nr:GNAT family N-acetyltransferase [Kofleriaceae bacterium]